MPNSARVLLYGLGLASVLTGPAGAQEIVGPPMQGDSTVVASGPPSEEAIPGLKSGTTALLLSFLGTAVPAVVGGSQVWESSGNGDWDAVMLIGGLVLGPSLGHFYADQPGRALIGIGIRMVATAAVGAAIASSASEGDSGEYDALGVVGVIVGGASLAWDIISAPHSARVHNDKLRQSQLGIGLLRPGDAPGLGLRVELSF